MPSVVLAARSCASSPLTVGMGPAMSGTLYRVGSRTDFGSRLTVLLSSHDMAEVEEICDNVTIMKQGGVVYHGTITELRKQAPPQAHLLHTSDNRRARELADSFATVAVVDADGCLAVRSPQDAVDGCVSL